MQNLKLMFKLCGNVSSGGGGSANVPIDKKLAEMWQQEEKWLTDLKEIKIN